MPFMHETWLFMQYYGKDVIRVVEYVARIDA